MRTIARIPILVIVLLSVSLLFASCTSEEIDEFFDATNKALDEMEQEKEREAKALIPKDYYSMNLFKDRPNTVTYLEGFMENDFFLFRKYRKYIHDCSEMTAWLEMALEDAGFDAYIVAGPAAWENGRITNHAWVIVRVSNGNRHAVDPAKFWKSIPNSEGMSAWEVFKGLFQAPPGIIRTSEPNWRGWFEYEYIWASIYDVPVSYLHEFDWWKNL